MTTFAELSCDALTLNSDSRKVFADGNPVKLNNKEFSLLRYFMENVGKVLTRTQILEDVWDRNIFCSTNTIDVHVSNLRRKVKVFSDNSFIRTVHCIGYIFDPSY